MTPVTRAFLRAAADGDINLIRGLLAQGADIDASNKAGQTALMLAAAFKRIEVVTLLTTNGADVEARDELGLSAFEWAGDSSDIVEILFRTPSNVEPEPTEEFPEPETQPASAVVPLSRLLMKEEMVRPEPHPDEPVLKGLAAAILRDHTHHTPKSSTNSPQTTAPPDPPIAAFVDDQPTPVHQFVDQTTIEPDIDSTATDQITDNTWGGTETEINDDTAASARPVSSSRIFDLRGSQEIQKPISKVEVAVPSFSSPATSKSGVVVWALVVVVLAGGGFGGYRLASYLLAGRATSAAGSATTTPQPQPAPAPPKKSAPVVGGELVGAELHLPDAEYPQGSTQGASGTVTVQVRVSKKGIVVGAKAVDGDQSLKAAAEDAAKRSAFSPEKLQDKPALMDGTITYHFIPPQQLGTGTTGPGKENTSKGVTITTGGPLAGAELSLKEPRESSAKGVTGTITIVVRVSRGGKVISWRPLDGESRLRSLAVNAAKLSTFSPDKLPGTGEVVGTITYMFR